MYVYIYIYMHAGRDMMQIDIVRVSARRGSPLASSCEPNMAAIEETLRRRTPQVPSVRIASHKPGSSGKI